MTGSSMGDFDVLGAWPSGALNALNALNAHVVAVYAWPYRLDVQIFDV